MINYLITGATGVVGNALMKALLKQKKYHLYLLIRAENQAVLNEKINKLQIPDESSKHNLTFVVGDISDVNFGIEKSKLNILQKKLNGIVHAAANVRLNQPIDVARRNAFTGTKAALDLAKSCEMLSHFHYISTVGVNGMSKSILLEGRAPDHVSYHNAYEQAKSEAERYVIQQMEDGFPCTIYRPSMIVGDSTSGGIYEKQIFYYICDFIIRGGTARVMPSLANFYLDTIPIDALTNFIVSCIMHSQDSVGKIYNVCAGYEHAINMQKLVKILKSSMNKNGRSIVSSVSVPISVYNVFLKFLFLMSGRHVKKDIQSLCHFISYLNNSPRFSNEQYSKDAQHFGLPIKFPSDYLNTIFDSYLSDS